MTPAGRCRFCRRTDGVLVAGEPARVGIQRGSTRYRMVAQYHHSACLQAEVEFNAASRARSDAEFLAGLRETLLEQGWSEERITAALARRSGAGA